jgi:hypothetical protein
LGKRTDTVAAEALRPEISTRRQEAIGVSSDERSPGHEELQAAPAEDDRPMKLCPDCAESVLAAARKCRFCGYRFDEADAVARDHSAGGLLGLLRRSTPRLTMAGALNQMGAGLRDGEQPVGMWLGRVDGVDGYVAITDVRLFFVGSVGRPKGSLPAQERLLSELIHVEVLRRRRKPTLVIDWRCSSSTVISKLSAKDLPRLHSLLLAHVRVADPPEE